MSLRLAIRTNSSLPRQDRHFTITVRLAGFGLLHASSPIACFAGAIAAIVDQMEKLAVPIVARLRLKEVDARIRQLDTISKNKVCSCHFHFTSIQPVSLAILAIRINLRA